MEIASSRLGTIGRAFAYGVLGFVGTAVVAVGLLNATGVVQRVVYDLLYWWLGPSEATETAILVNFLLVVAVGISVPMLLGDYLSDRLANRVAFGYAAAALLGAVIVFLLVALLHLAAFLTALVVLGVVLVAVPLALRYRFGVRSGGVPAFVGGVPVLFALLLVTGFGLGWGWGYVVTAEEVPASSVDGTPPDFAGAPAVAADLFDEANCAVVDGARTCRLSLRGYEHETAAARFLANNGVRCPYLNAATDTADGAVLAHEGTYYRVTCSPHGD